MITPPIRPAVTPTPFISPPAVRACYHAEVPWGECHTAALDLLKEGALPSKGFIRNENVPFEAFIANRFGKHDAYDLHAMKNYVIAGGSSGIGKALTEQLLTAGHRVYVLARAARALEPHPNLQFIETDFSVAAPVIQGLPEEIHGLAYCPGSIQLQPFHRMKEDLFLNDYRINVLGAVHLIQAALPALKKPGQSSIVLFSTVAVQTGMPFHASIAAAKGAVEGLTRSLAAEFATAGIRVNAIAPSLTNTPLADRLLNSPEKLDASNKRHPIGRVGQPAEVAALAALLLGEHGSWMTGQVLHLDGGMGQLRLFA